MPLAIAHQPRLTSGTRAAMEMMTALVKTNSAADERAWN